MLLPEPNRSGVPYLISVTIQCSLVLSLAIPWTVQRLTNGGSIQVPTLLFFQNLKPADPIKMSHTQAMTPSSLPALPRRIFRPFTPSSSSPPSSTSVGVDGPEIEFTSGGTSLPGLAVPPFPAVVVNAIPAPTPPVSAHALLWNRRDQQLVGGNVQEAKLIRRVQPVYPALARQVASSGRGDARSSYLR